MLLVLHNALQPFYDVILFSQLNGNMGIYISK